MIVTAHQPNYLPGLSVIEKLEAADAVIWLTEVQYPRGGFTNRNRMPDGSWLTVPVDHSTTDGPISDVKISEHKDWRRVHGRTLRQHYSNVEAICAEIERPHQLLVELNLACLALLTDESRWYFQAPIDNGEGTISERLARMAALLGGTTYLSGPSGRRYHLDDRPFAARGIAVDYFAWDRAENPCALERLRTDRQLMEATRPSC